MANIENCVAAVYVKGDTFAGGLIGCAESGQLSIIRSYSSGHTNNSVYGTEDDDTTIGRYNVIASDPDGIAGGFAAFVPDGTVITCSYSTCSVKGTNASCFIFSGYSVDSGDGCYATGLVNGSNNSYILDTVKVDRSANIAVHYDESLSAIYPLMTASQLSDTDSGSCPWYIS